MSQQIDQPPEPKPNKVSAPDESPVVRESVPVTAATSPAPEPPGHSTEIIGGEVGPERERVNVENPMSPLPGAAESGKSAMSAEQPPAAMAREKTPWWRTAKAVPVWVALVTLIGPISTGMHAAVSGYNERLLAERQFQSNQQLAEKGHADAVEMAKAQQRHDITFKYFQLAVDPKSSPELQQRVLRYLANPDIGTWAGEELVRVDEYIELKKERDRLEQEAFENATKAAENKEELERLQYRQAKLLKKLTETNQRLQDHAIPGADQIAAEPTAESEATTLRCKPGTITVEFRGEAEAHRCGGKPSSTAYIGTTGWIYWSVAEGKMRFTCLCQRG